MFEFFTFNFNIIVMTLERISLVMSDPAYQGIFIFAVLASVLIWGFGVSVGRVTGGHHNIFSGVVMILIGVSVYIGFIEQRGDMVVQEQGTTSPRMMVVPDVPEGVRVMLSVYNGIIRTIIPVITASGNVDTPAALDYLNNSKGDIFNILRFVFESTTFTPGEETSGEYLNLTIRDYFSNCLLWQIHTPQSNFTLEDFSEGTSIIDIIEYGQLGLFNTVLYTTDNPQGENVTCTEAGEQIIDELNNIAANQTNENGTYYNFWTSRCQKAGYYDPDRSGQAIQSCRDKVMAFLATLDPNSQFNDMEVLQTYVVSSQIAEYLKTHNVEALADYRISSAMKGEGAAGMRWIPMLQSGIFATYLGLMPFLALLIPTVIADRILKFIFAVFVFLICWEICDALLYGYAIDMAFASFHELMNNGLSLKMLWMMEGESYTSLLMFTKARWAAMGLSAALTAIIIPAGAQVLGSLSGMVSGTAAEGTSAGEEVTDPVQRAHGMAKLTGTTPVNTIFNREGFSNLTFYDFFEKGTDVEGARQELADFGYDVEKAMEFHGEANAFKDMQNIAEHEMALMGITGNYKRIKELTKSRRGKEAIFTRPFTLNTPGGTVTYYPTLGKDGGVDDTYVEIKEGFYHQRPTQDESGTKTTQNDITTTAKNRNGEYTTTVTDDATGERLTDDRAPITTWSNFARDLFKGELVDKEYDVGRDPYRAATLTAEAVSDLFQRQVTEGYGHSVHGGLGAHFGINIGAKSDLESDKNFIYNSVTKELMDGLERLKSDGATNREQLQFLQDRYLYYRNEEPAVKETLDNLKDNISGGTDEEQGFGGTFQ